MKKVSTLLSLLIVMSMFLSGCGQSPAPQESSAAPASSEAGSSVSAAEEPAELEEPAEIIWIIRQDEPPNTDIVMEALNEKLLDEVNMTLDLRLVSPGDYNDKMQMTLAGGDEWDLCYTASWTNNYVNNVGQGAYLAVDDLLGANAPGYMSIFPQKLLDGARVSGKLYGMPNYQVMYDQAGYYFFKDVAEELGLVDEIKAIASWGDLTNVLRKVKEGKPEIYATRGGIGGVMMFLEQPVSLILNLPFLAFDPETKTISKTMFFNAFDEGYSTVEIWHREGLQPPDAATLKDETTLIRQGQIFSRYSRQKPGGDTEFFVTWERESIQLPTSTKIVDTNAVQSTITAVSANSKNPERAIRLYDYFFTNQEAFNLLIFGMEGQDYERVDENYIRKTPSTYALSAWMLGNQFNAYLTEGQDIDVWEQTMKANEDAMVDDLFGFVPNREPIETELSVCETIHQEYTGPTGIIHFGLQDHNAAIAEMMVKLDAAGLDRVIEELQSQLDDFFAGK